MIKTTALLAQISGLDTQAACAAAAHRGDVKDSVEPPMRVPHANVTGSDSNGSTNKARGFTQWNNSPPPTPST
jgi:hypothetical protein